MLLLLLLAGCGLFEEEAEGLPPPTGGGILIPTVTPGPAPGVELARLDGGRADLSAWRGRAVIVNFWATWCYPCRTEMPDLARIHEQYPEDVVVVGVNFLEEAEEAQAFVDEMALPFPILMDERGLLADALDVQGLPTTFFLDREGKLVGSHVGPLDLEELEEVVAGLIGQGG